MPPFLKMGTRIMGARTVVMKVIMIETPKISPWMTPGLAQLRLRSALHCLGHHADTDAACSPLIEPNRQSRKSAAGHLPDNCKDANHEPKHQYRPHSTEIHQHSHHYEEYRHKTVVKPTPSALLELPLSPSWIG